jgi:serine/threonine protein phosphatase PrpC
MTCLHCGAAAVAGDAFCEACGGALVGVPAVGADDAAPASAAPAAAAAPGDAGADDPGVDLDGGVTAEQPRTHLVDPGAAPDPMGHEVGVPCVACGGEVDDDGFCSQCGRRARTRREHWTETHGDRIGAVCDKGIVHARNEDAMATGIGSGGTAVAVVCDGVTTAPDSDRASLAASRAALELLVARPATSGSTASRVSAWGPALVASCRVAHAEAVAVARSLGDPPEPPSCTFVATVVDGDLVATAWCGDSRTYWLPDGGAGAEQLTVDHSLGTEMIRGGMSRVEAEARAESHTITRWLGADSVDPTPELRTLQVSVPGWVLVCSDGLWNEASTPGELVALVADARGDGAGSPTAIAESLAAFANARGGRDNVTVALVRVEPPLP